LIILLPTEKVTLAYESENIKKDKNSRQNTKSAQWGSIANDFGNAKKVSLLFFKIEIFRSVAQTFSSKP